MCLFPCGVFGVPWLTCEGMCNVCTLIPNGWGAMLCEPPFPPKGNEQSKGFVQNLLKGP